MKMKLTNLVADAVANFMRGYYQGQNAARLAVYANNARLAYVATSETTSLRPAWKPLQKGN